ncbi:MAG: hypothetical protein ACO1QB_07870 [Verrucomicrobiales bacterium]
MTNDQRKPGELAGQFVRGAHELGTVTQKMVEERAKELAVTQGKNGNDFTTDDLERAKAELTGQFEGDGSIDTEPTSRNPAEPRTQTGRKVPARGAQDEQMFADELVQEGVNEATHHTLLAGNTTETKQTS